MMQSPGQGGKAASSPTATGKGASTPQGPQAGKGASTGTQGASTGPQPAANPMQGGPPGILQLFGQMLSGGGGQSQPTQSQQSGTGAPPQSRMPLQGAGHNTASPVMGGATRPGFPLFQPEGQGFHGASSAQQNPNQGGASTSPSASSNPSTTQGGMGGI